VHRILIADDHAAIRHALVSLLSSYGFVVCGQAINGREALERAQELHPDLIVLDCSMPMMSGLEAARELKKLMPDVPLIMLTSYVFKDIEEEATKAGVRRVILKDDAHQRLVPEALEVLSRAVIS
jgi:CheY-like chemotaxis protein